VLDDEDAAAQLYFQEEDVLLLNEEEEEQGDQPTSAPGQADYPKNHDQKMGNAASTDQSGAAGGAAAAGAPGGAMISVGPESGSGGGGSGDQGHNPGFARMQGVTAARADGQRTKPRGPPAPAAQYEFLQVRVMGGEGVEGDRETIPERIGAARTNGGENASDSHPTTDDVCRRRRNRSPARPP
jgi:hypothetical protein